MNKKEMIEEMAKLCCWFQNRKCIANPGIDDLCDMSCEYGQACEKLMSEGYRKLPKGSVVLSKKEYVENLCNRFEKGYEKGSKETAIKIAFDIESRLAYYKDEDTFTKTEILLEIKEILKENGVEV